METKSGVTKLHIPKSAATHIATAGQIEEVTTADIAAMVPVPNSNTDQHADLRAEEEELSDPKLRRVRNVASPITPIDMSAVPTTPLGIDLGVGSVSSLSVDHLPIIAGGEKLDGFHETRLNRTSARSPMEHAEKRGGNGHSRGGAKSEG